MENLPLTEHGMTVFDPGAAIRQSILDTIQDRVRSQLTESTLDTVEGKTWVPYVVSLRCYELR